jgi:hypothetical protein
MLNLIKGCLAREVAKSNYYIYVHMKPKGDNLVIFVS